MCNTRQYMDPDVILAGGLLSFDIASLMQEPYEATRSNSRRKLAQSAKNLVFSGAPAGLSSLSLKTPDPTRFLHPRSAHACVEHLT